MAQTTHLSLRLRTATLDRLARRAARVGELKTSLAARYVEEGLRMEEHPGIVFRAGPAGRRAGLAGHRLDLWQVIETVRNEGGDVEAAARYLAVSPGVVAVAAGHYGDPPRRSTRRSRRTPGWRRRWRRRGAGGVASSPREGAPR